MERQKDEARRIVQRERSRADAAVRRGAWHEAEEHLTSALGVVDENASLLTYRSRARLKQQKVSHALADAQLAVALQPATASSYNCMGRAMLASGEQERMVAAGSAYCRSLALTPRDPNTSLMFDGSLSLIRRGRPYFLGRAREQEVALDSPGKLPRGRPPAACARPTVTAESHTALYVTWTDPADNGGAEIYRYEVQLAAVDPLHPEAACMFETVYTGHPGGESCQGDAGSAVCSTVVGDLSPDTEYAVRVAASNDWGRAEWCEPTRACTTRAPPKIRQLDTRVPEAWLELRANMSDLATSLEKRFGTCASSDWHALVRVWGDNLAPLRLAFRMYTLLGNTEAMPRDISLTQFRKLVDDCHVLKRTSTAKVEVDLIFTRVNRTVNNGGLGARGGSSESAGREDQNKMGQDEFVHALVRLALLRAEQRVATSATSACAACSMASSFELLVEECIKPHASFELHDALSKQLDGRAVRAALAKHREALRRQFLHWAGADKGVGCDDGTMSLSELVLALKEAKVLDETCTAREVTRLFVMVNADDDIYVMEGGAARRGHRGKGAAELDYDEFCEVLCRICDQKCPEPREGPFANTLDTWLQLFFLPALRHAGKATSTALG